LLEKISQSIGSGFEIQIGQSITSSEVTFLHHSSGIEFRYIPAGLYSMGFSDQEELAALEICDSGSIQANIDEMRPVHITEVHFLLMSSSPILNHQSKSLLSIYTDQPDFEPALLNWDQTQELAQIMNCRLPQEKEWEYACRAGSETLFVFGNQLPCDKELEKWLSLDFSEPTALNKNCFGLYGLFTGEWCQDIYKPNYSSSDLEGKDTNTRVIRGGGAMFWPWQGEEWVWCMSAMRMPSTDLIDGRCSMRLVYDLPELEDELSL
jgi:hypothetical protein